MFDQTKRILDISIAVAMPRVRAFAGLLCALVSLAVLEAGPAHGVTIFGSGPQTEAADAPVFDPTNYELGTVFQSSVAGDITGLRVYIGPVEGGYPGDVVGRLWDGSGSLLATASFGSLAVGWNEVSLSTPFSISAGSTYVVSANTNAGTTGTGSYAFNRGPLGDGFFAGGFTSGPLTATAGVFSTTVGAFPTSNFPSTNGGSSYFRDITFVPVPEPSTALLICLGLAALSGSGSRRDR